MRFVISRDTVFVGHGLIGRIFPVDADGDVLGAFGVGG
jgi:hypothetical protein